MGSNMLNMAPGAWFDLGTDNEWRVCVTDVLVGLEKIEILELRGSKKSAVDFQIFGLEITTNWCIISAQLNSL